MGFIIFLCIIIFLFIIELLCIIIIFLCIIIFFCIIVAADAGEMAELNSTAIDAHTTISLLEFIIIMSRQCL